MTICWNGQSGDRVKMIGSHGWLRTMFEHAMQLALILQIEASIPGQYTNSLVCASMLTTPWCAKFRLCKTFLHWVLGMTVLWSNNTRQLSVLRWCLTSQYSWTSGAVRLRVLGEPCCITFINFLYHGLPWPAAWLRSGDMIAILLLPANVAIKAVDSIISIILLDSRISECDGLAGNTSRRVCIMATGWRETVSKSLFPRQCWMVDWYLRVFSFSQNSQGFWILLRSWSLNNPLCSSWSVTTMMFWKLMMNIQHFSNAHAIAAASPSIGAYLRSASVQNLLPANVGRQPSGHQIGAFSTVHWQCFCRSWKPIPSLLRSGTRQVTQSLSNITTPFWTRSVITHLESLNASLRLWFQANLFDKVLKEQHDWTQWVCSGLTSPKHDLESVIVLGTRKVDYCLYHGLRKGHSRSYLEASKLYHILTELEFVCVEPNSILHTLEQEIKSMIKGSLDVSYIAGPYLQSSPCLMCECRCLQMQDNLEPS